MPEYAAPTELEKLFWGAFTTKIALLRSWKAAALMSSVQKAFVFHSTKNSEEPNKSATGLQHLGGSCRDAFTRLWQAT